MNNLVIRYPILKSLYQSRIEFLNQALDTDPAWRSSIHARMVPRLPPLQLPDQRLVSKVKALVIRNTMNGVPHLPSRRLFGVDRDDLWSQRRDALRRFLAVSRKLRNSTADVLLIGGSLVEGWADNFWSPLTVLRVTGDRAEDVLWLLKALPRSIAFRCALCAIDPAQFAQMEQPTLVAKTILSIVGQVNMKRRPRPCGIIEMLPDLPSPNPVEDLKRDKINHLLRGSSTLTINADIVSQDIISGGREEFRLRGHGYRVLSRMVFHRINELLIALEADSTGKYRRFSL